MTRLAVLADIHGNLPALEAVLADLRQAAVDEILVAGDIVGGAAPARTLHRLQEIGCLMIRGNHEGYALNWADTREKVEARWALDQWAAMRWWCGRLDEEDMAAIGRLPEHREIRPARGTPIRMVHGSMRHSSEMVFPSQRHGTLSAFQRAGQVPLDGRPPPLAPRVAGLEEKTLICAHTHIPWRETWRGHLIINPGSVGVPINGDRRAQYAILSWQDEAGEGGWEAAFHAVPYDIGKTREAYHRSGYLQEGGPFARAQLLTIETAQNVQYFVIKHAWRLAQNAGVAAPGEIPDAIWQTAMATFPWQQYTPDDETVAIAAQQG